MEYGEKFKKSLVGGFDRQDVLNCLQELNTRHERELAALQKELTGYKTANEQLKQEREEQTTILTERDTTIASVQGRLAAEQEQTEHLSTQLEKTRDQLEQQTALAENLQRELTSQRATNSELLMKKNVLTENVKQLTEQLETLQRKQEDRASFEIGEMLIEAKITADGMISRANDRATKVLELIHSQAEGAEMRITGLQQKLAETVEGFKRISVGFVRSVEEVHRELDGCKMNLHDTAVDEPTAPVEQPAPIEPDEIPVAAEAEL